MIRCRKWFQHQNLLQNIELPNGLKFRTNKQFSWSSLKRTVAFLSSSEKSGGKDERRVWNLKNKYALLRFVFQLIRTSIAQFGYRKSNLKFRTNKQFSENSPRRTVAFLFSRSFSQVNFHDRHNGFIIWVRFSTNLPSRDIFIGFVESRDQGDRGLGFGSQFKNETNLSPISNPCFSWTFALVGIRSLLGPRDSAT